LIELISIIFNYVSDRLLAKEIKIMSNWSYIMQQQQLAADSAIRAPLQHTELETDII